LLTLQTIVFITKLLNFAFECLNLSTHVLYEIQQSRDKRLLCTLFYLSVLLQNGFQLDLYVLRFHGAKKEIY